MQSCNQAARQLIAQMSGRLSELEAVVLCVLDASFLKFILCITSAAASTSLEQIQKQVSALKVRRAEVNQRLKDLRSDVVDREA